MHPADMSENAFSIRQFMERVGPVAVPLVDALRSLVLDVYKGAHDAGTWVGTDSALSRLNREGTLAALTGLAAAEDYVDAPGALVEAALAIGDELEEALMLRVKRAEKK